MRAHVCADKPTNHQAHTLCPRDDIVDKTLKTLLSAANLQHFPPRNFVRIPIEHPCQPESPVARMLLFMANHPLGKL